MLFFGDVQWRTMLPLRHVAIEHLRRAQCAFCNVDANRGGRARDDASDPIARRNRDRAPSAGRERINYFANRLQGSNGVKCGHKPKVGRGGHPQTLASVRGGSQQTSPEGVVLAPSLDAVAHARA